MGVLVALDLHGIRIQQMVLHEIPRATRGAGLVTPLLSDAASPLSDDLQTFFESRIVVMASSEESSRCVFVANSPSPLPDLMVKLRDGTETLLEVSRRAASHLASVQNAASSGGLLALAQCTHSNNPAWVFLKLEHDEGARAQWTNANGRRVLAIEHVRELILTERTRLFKQAFIQNSQDGFFLEVGDSQHQRTVRAGVASYFLDGFLGAAFELTDREATRRFANAVERLIGSVPDPGRQVALRLNLVSVLSGRGRTSVNAFAREFLEDEEISVFRDAARDLEVPSAAFVRDNALVSGLVSRMKIVGASGIALVGSPDAIRERVDVRLDAAGPESTLTARDTFHVE